MLPDRFLNLPSFSTLKHALKKVTLGNKNAYVLAIISIFMICMKLWQH
jgi:hypothetical protein